ncbi:primosomal protein N' [soil metagenome]
MRPVGGMVELMPDKTAPLFRAAAAAQAKDLRLVRVAVTRGIERGAKSSGTGDLHDALLTYSVAPDAEVAPGQLVRVPLGRKNTPVAGIVVEVGGPELLGDIPAERIKPVSGVTAAVLPGPLLELAQWMAHYYICPLGMVTQAVLPAAVKRQVGRKIEQHVVGLSENGRAAVAAAAVQPGRGKKIAAARPAAGAETGADSGGAAPAIPPRLSPKARAALQTIMGMDAGELPSSAIALAAEHGITAALLKRLTTLGLLETREVESVVARGEVLMLPPAPAAPEFTLTAEQHTAVEGISATLGSFAQHLLLGVTGSGKTEVYLQVIERLLRDTDRRGGAESGAIVLVPEIALTPQTSARFVQRFGATVAVLHSGLTSAQRNAQWARAARGSVRVVVGARSAVFAPLPKVGVIVVDEEHDHSYKQDQLPRYHARDVAVKRAQLEGCPVILGSATPALESYVNALGPHPKSTLWRLPLRATGARMPRVDIVDLADQRRLRAQLHPGGWRDRQLHLLGPTLETAIDQTLGAGGQIILLLNRRGYANYLSCPDPRCGWVMHCDHCDAASVYHLHAPASAARTPGFVRCHHCLAEQLLPKKCPVCAKPVNTFGLGTQRVEEELQRKFHHTHGLALGTTLLRLDSDTMRSAADYFSALQRFGSGEVKMLVGTQMIAKGLDFPNVRLVGVVSADTALNLPDFRAAERTFQLVAQVAGRAGRGAHAGRVIVQTMAPREPAIVLAARHDYEAFAERELALRREAALPPITRMARIVCRDEKLERAQGAAAALATNLRALGAAHPDLRVRGPMPCPISRIADHFRIAIELLAQTRGALQSVLGELRGRGLLISDAHTAVDVDPIAML